MKENQENQTGVQVATQKTSEVSAISIQQETHEIDLANLDKTAEMIENSVTIPIKANIEAWKPKEGDIIKGIFTEIVNVMMPPVGDKTGEKHPVSVVVFLVPKVITDKSTGEEIKTLEKISILGARAVNHFSSTTPKTLWSVEFVGQKLVNSKPNNIYNFYPATSQK